MVQHDGNYRHVSDTLKLLAVDFKCFHHTHTQMTGTYSDTYTKNFGLVFLCLLISKHYIVYYKYT